MTEKKLKKANTHCPQSDKRQHLDKRQSTWDWNLTPPYLKNIYEPQEKSDTLEEMDQKIKHLEIKLVTTKDVPEEIEKNRKPKKSPIYDLITGNIRNKKICLEKL